jgi:hypothetical protein
MLGVRYRVVSKLVIYGFSSYLAFAMVSGLVSEITKTAREDLLGGGIAVIACGIVVVWLSISAAIQTTHLLDRMKFYACCPTCKRPMRRRSVWTRFVKTKTEIALGYRDCIAALKTGFWEDAAKLVCIHGAEHTSLYSSRTIDTPLRYNLEFHECIACIQHVARLTTDELVEEKWLTRPEFMQASRLRKKE